MYAAQVGCSRGPVGESYVLPCPAVPRTYMYLFSLSSSLSIDRSIDCMPSLSHWIIIIFVLSGSIASSLSISPEVVPTSSIGPHSRGSADVLALAVGGVGGLADCQRADRRHRESRRGTARGAMQHRRGWQQAQERSQPAGDGTGGAVRVSQMAILLARGTRSRRCEQVHHDPVTLRLAVLSYA
jgi:hypothetical protein